MKAVILAAGMGSRLGKAAGNKPKAMIEFLGKPLIAWQVSALRRAGITDITVVTGYMHHLLQIPGINSVRNDKYASTNMVESLMCARDKLAEGFVLSYADILYDAALVEKVACAVHPVAVAGDSQWQAYWKARFPDNWQQDLESFSVDGDGVITDIGRPVENVQGITHRYVGLMRFSASGARELVACYDRKKTLGDAWMQSGKPFQQGYMTDILCELSKSQTPPTVVEVSGGWLEFDEPDDIRLGQALFAKADRGEPVSVRLPNLNM